MAVEVVMTFIYSDKKLRLRMVKVCAQSVGVE